MALEGHKNISQQTQLGWMDGIARESSSPEIIIIIIII